MYIKNYMYTYRGKMKNNTLKFIWVWAMLCSTWLLAETRSHEVKGEVNATSKKFSKKQKIKSPVGYDEPNYLFTYALATEIHTTPWSITMVLVKNHVPVSAALQYDDYWEDKEKSKDTPRFIHLDKAEHLALVMDIIKGKKCQKGESNKFDAAHFPITIERCSIAYDSKSKTCEYGGEAGYASFEHMVYKDEPKTYCGEPYFYFTHYEKVNASYTKIDLKKERFKELERNHKKWRALNLKSYRLVYSPSNTIENVTSEVDNGGFVKQTISHKYSKAYKDTDIPQEERFLVMDDVFAYVKEKLEESSCKVLVEYQIDIKKYWYPHALYVECKGEKLKRIYIDMTVSENKENTNEK